MDIGVPEQGHDWAFARKSSSRAWSVWRAVAAGIVAVGALALLAAGGSRRTGAYGEGWNYVVRSFATGQSIGSSGAFDIDCSAAANAAFHSGLSYGMRTQASYQRVSQWAQGCIAASQAVQSSGLGGFQIQLQ